MVVDLLQNYQRSLNYEDREDFFAEMCIEDEEDLDKVEVWWSSMITMRNFVMRVLYKKYKVVLDIHSFVEYCEEL